MGLVESELGAVLCSSPNRSPHAATGDPDEPTSRFPPLLIEPCVRFSRTRLSDGFHTPACAGDPRRKRRRGTTPSSPNTRGGGARSVPARRAVRLGGGAPQVPIAVLPVPHRPAGVAQEGERLGPPVAHPGLLLIERQPHLGEPPTGPRKDLGRPAPTEDHAGART